MTSWGSTIAGAAAPRAAKPRSRRSQRVLRLYRERYGPRDGHPGFNVRHFHHLARRDHGVRLSYSFVKLALQEAGLVRKARRGAATGGAVSPGPALGSCLHLDGSPHAWLALRPVRAPNAHRHHRRCHQAPALRPALARRDDRGRHERPARRASRPTGCRWPCTPTGPAGPFTPPPPAARSISRAPRSSAARCTASASRTFRSYSPQARGRGERLHRTLQGRLINELRLAGIPTVAAANAYLRERFIARLRRAVHPSPQRPGQSPSSPSAP